MLLFDNEEIARNFSAVELQRSKLSPSATSMVGQRAQATHRTLSGEVSGESFMQKLQTSAINVSTTSEPAITRVVRDQRTTDRCPVGEVYDRIEQMCIPGPSQAESGLTPGLQTFVPKVSTDSFTRTSIPQPELVPSAPTRAVTSQAPAPVVPDTKIPQSVVSTAPFLRPQASAPSRAAEPTLPQASLVSFEPEDTGFLNKRLIGGFKVKHALIGTGVLGVLGAGILALRTTG